MPGQLSEILGMQRERIDLLEENYKKVYQRYER